MIVLHTAHTGAAHCCSHYRILLLATAHCRTRPRALSHTVAQYRFHCQTLTLPNTDSGYTQLHTSTHTAAHCCAQYYMHCHITALPLSTAHTVNYRHTFAQCRSHCNAYVAACTCQDSTARTVTYCHTFAQCRLHCNVHAAALMIYTTRK